MNQLLAKRIVPVAVIDRVDDAVSLAQALRAGGLNVIEITFRTAAAADCIRAIRQQVPDMFVGAGTLLNTDQLKAASAAGAQFGVAPGFNPTIVRESQAIGLPFVPGVMTPSEIEGALALGCKIQKLFPASVAGGIEMLKALTGPYAHTGVKFIPLGGVGPKTVPDYLALPIVAAIGGSWLCEKRLIADRDWVGITRLAEEAVALAASK